MVTARLLTLDLEFDIVYIDESIFDIVTAVTSASYS